MKNRPDRFAQQGGRKIQDEATLGVHPAFDGAATLNLRVLATSDLHAHILPWDYHTDRASETRGLSRIAGLVTQARAEARNVLLLDNGDFLHGSPLGDYMAQQAGGLPDDAPEHPMVTAMNRLGYDAATLGNHEFSHGIGMLRQSLRAARFPVVSANLRHQADDSFFVAPFAVLDRVMTDEAGVAHPLRVGVIGFLPPQTVVWEKAQLQGQLTAADIVKTARAMVPKLRAQGVDLVIALSHSGLGAGLGADGETLGGDENASLALAAVEGIDAVIAGHTHEVFPPHAGLALLNGTPAVMPGFFGSHLGVIDLMLRRVGTCWQVVAHRAEARPIAGREAGSGRAVALVAGHPEIEDMAAPLHAALKAQGDRVVGQTLQPLHSYFALVAGSAALRLVAAAQADHVAGVLAGSHYAGLPLVSAVAPFKAGGRGGPENYTDIPAGQVTERHLSDLYLHPNRLVALRVTGAELALWLERAASLFLQVAAGAQDADLVNADFPGFNFDMLHGLTYRIDVSQPARFDAKGRVLNPSARRITDLCHNGQPVDPEAEFCVATNSYRSSGGAGFPACLPERAIYTSPAPNRDILRHFIARGGAAQAMQPAPHWGFAPLGASVILQAAPAAAQHLADLSPLRPQPLDRLANGYQRFRLHL